MKKLDRILKKILKILCKNKSHSKTMEILKLLDIDIDNNNINLIIDFKKCFIIIEEFEEMKIKKLF
jgi:hypothetical protein